MKIAITGASGYVGSRIARRLREQGHEVLSLSRRPCPEPWLSWSLGDNPGTLPLSDIDLLIHAAYDFEPRSWKETYDQNVAPSIALLRAAYDSKVSNSIFISSMSCFEGCHSRYGKAKRMIEIEALKLGVIVIRPGLVWGETSGGVMGALEKIVTRLPIVPALSGGGGLLQSLVHEDDFTAALATIAQDVDRFRGKIIPLAFQDPISLLAILRTIAARSGLSRRFVPVPWQLAMAGLKSLETVGIDPPFRSDSLVGLVHFNPKEDEVHFPEYAEFRPFR